MKINKRIKQLQRSAARNSIVFFFWLISWVPFPLVKLVMRICLWIAFHFTFKLKGIARETLTVALGKEKTPQEITEIIHGCFKTLGKGMIDLLYYSRFPQRFKDRFVIEGREHLDQALAQGKGVIAATAHFGNFPLMMLALTQCGYRVNVIIRRARDEKVGGILLNVMSRVGVNSVFSQPRRECVQNSLRVLRNNEILFILMDHNFGSEGGVFVNFFGHQAATAPGPVVIAARTNSPIIPMFNVNEPDSKLRIFIEPELKLEQCADNDEMINRNVSRLTEIIERYIRRYPVEWGWMHRRFKSQAPTHAAPLMENKKTTLCAQGK